uniref:Uncharacterized protein n=1 Tax=Arcella intermedia TaxID=1963864 RepID=A0A6B2LHY0_9EUKA
MTAMNWVNRLRPALMACKDNPKCAIWEFSESNYVHSIDNYGTQLPTIILPVTLRSRSVPTKVTPLDERKHGFIFYGYGNERRNHVTEALKQRLNRWETPQNEAAYLDSKFCVSVHFYAADSGIELHRLAQHVKMGCLPVYETPGDPMAIRFFQHHETLLFENHAQFVQKVFTINDCISSDLGYMLEQQKFVAEWWSRELELFEKVLKAFFYEYF